VARHALQSLVFFERQITGKKALVDHVLRRALAALVRRRHHRVRRLARPRGRVHHHERPRPERALAVRLAAAIPVAQNSRMPVARDRRVRNVPAHVLHHGEREVALVEQPDELGDEVDLLGADDLSGC
jgi:hypothetical protein